MVERDLPFHEENTVLVHAPVDGVFARLDDPKSLAAGESSLLRIFIGYSLPATTFGYWFGRLLAGVYARWCVRRMAVDARNHFNSS